MHSPHRSTDLSLRTAAAAAASSRRRSCSSFWPISPPRIPTSSCWSAMRRADDAAVWQQDENTCIIATTDFFHADGRRPA
mgnify:CR=1 FL=1